MGGRLVTSKMLNGAKNLAAGGEGKKVLSKPKRRGINYSAP